MRIFKKLLPLVLVAIFSVVFAQTEMAQKNTPGELDLHYDLMNSANPTDISKSRLNVYIEVKYDELQFVKVEQGFEAHYEASVVVLDNDNDQVDGKIWKEKIAVQNFDETNARETYSLTFQSFDLEPEEYKVALTVQDVESKSSAMAEKKIKLANFKNKDLAMSDVLFLNSLTLDSLGIKSIRPQTTDPGKGVGKPLYAYFEVYSRKSKETAQVQYTIKGKNNRKEIKDEYKIELTDDRTLQAIQIPVDSLAHDEYEFEISVKSRAGKASAAKSFYVRFAGLPATVNDLEEAIEQVQYIATREEWNALRKSRDEKRLNAFLKFWLRHDPTPGTEENEALEAHYSRVEYANQKFAVMQRKGWKTDMGMVYILLGAPDDVIRNAYPSDSNSYELWDYYRYNRRFEFYDYTGFGEYRLINPHSIYELQRYLTN